MKNLIIIFFISSISLLHAQTKDTSKFEYGVIHYDIRDSKLDTYFGGENKIEILSGGKDYYLKILELLNFYGQQGWDLCSSDTYQSMKWGSNPNTALILYLKRKK